MFLVTTNLAHLASPADPSLPLCGVHRTILRSGHVNLNVPMCEDCMAHLDALNRELMSYAA